MTNEEKKQKLYAALAAPFPESCVERTEGRTTGRGYDTAGIGYQHVVNRLNEVLGLGAFRAHRTVTVKEVTRANGRPAYEAICDLTLELGTWEDGEFVVFAEALADGGHVSASEADARKGCFTNAFKKAAAFFGVGRQAYEGTLDDDNIPPDVTEAAPAPQQHVARAAEPAPSAEVVARRSPTPANTPPARNRLSSKQHSAICAIARKAGLDLASLRAQVRQRYSTNLEFISREQASELIDALNRKLNGNGHAEPEGVAQAAH